MNSGNKKVTALILTHNQSVFTKDCVESLLKSDYPNIEIVVVDNGSDDNTTEMLRSSFPQVVVLRNERNLGAAGGRNTGIKYFLERTDSDYLFFLDNDTVIDKSAVSELVRLAEKNRDTGIAMAFLLYYDRPNMIHAGGGGMINWRKGFFFSSMQGETLPPEPLEREVEVALTAMMLVKREAVEKSGMFDERFFIYHEDADWCVRVREAGFKITATSRAKVFHKVSRSVGMESPLFYYYRTRNRLLFMKKNARLSNRFCFFFYFIYELCFTTIPTLVLNKKYEQFKGVLAGILDHIFGRYGEKR